MFRDMALKTRLIGSFALLIAFLLVQGVAGWVNLERSVRDLHNLEDQGVSVLRLAVQIRTLVLENHMQLALALQHDPSLEVAKLHDHPTSFHLDIIRKNRQRLDALLAELNRIALPDHIKAKLDAAAEARRRYGEEGLLPAVEALKVDEFYEAAYILTNRMNPLLKEVDATTQAVVEAIQQDTQAMHVEAERRNTNTQWLTLALVTMAVGAAALVGWLLLRQIVRPLRHATEVFDKIAQGSYDNTIAVERRDEIGRMLEALRAMQDKLARDIGEIRRMADENTRIRIALDNVSTGVMIADKERKIIYANKSVIDLIGKVEAEIRQNVPSFSARNLLGCSIDAFHKNPEHQARILASLSGTHTAAIRIGPRHMVVRANPVLNERGERLGAVLEWADRTAEALVEEEIGRLIDAAAAGDFSRRVSLEGKEGFFRQLSEGIDLLLQTTERGINDVARVLRAMSEGDLTQRIEADYQGLFGELKEASNTTSERLKEIVAQIRAATDAINTAAREIAAGNANLSSRTEAQASSLEETASSMDELTSTVKQNADNARQANQLAQGAASVAVKGGEVVGEVVSTMGAIAEASKKIADIIGVIDGIAFQTNILALNAAVEAARAGEQGRGFAVVAGEVRNLAQRSAAAAKEIKGLISDSVDKVDNGSKLVEQAGATMDEIVQAVRRVTDIMGEITAASVEQSQGIEQVNLAVTQMDEMTQQNAALVEQAAAAAESLQDQADGLAQAVSVFKLESGPGMTAPARVVNRVVSRPAVTKTHKAPAPARSPAKSLPKPGPSDADEWEEF